MQSTQIGWADATGTPPANKTVFVLVPSRETVREGGGESYTLRVVVDSTRADRDIIPRLHRRRKLLISLLIDKRMRYRYLYLIVDPHRGN